MKKIIIVLVLVIGVNACNQENVTSTDLSGNQAIIENDMIALSNSIRYTTRINVGATGRIFENNAIDVEQLEKELIDYHKNNRFENFQSDYDEFSNTESTIELDTHISNLLNDSNEINDSGRLSENTTLDELLYGFLEGLEGSNVSDNVSKNLRVLIDQLNKVTNDYQEKLRSSSELVDGEEVLTSYDEEEYARIIKAETGAFENQIVENESILQEEKEIIFYFTTVILFNIDDTNSFYEAFDNVSNKSGRVGGFWKKLKRVFRKVVSAVITVVVTAAYIAKNMATFGWVGPGAAVIAGVTGFIRGVNTSHFVNCRILNICY